MSKHQVTKIIFYSTLLMALTSVHHIYGAIIYSTPWRLHVLLISLPVILITFVTGKFLIKERVTHYRMLFWIFWMATLVPSICLIGIFEGIYNHVLKNILFYGGLSRGIFLQLFPSPTYEIPNDFWFEVTGILQGVVVIPSLKWFSRLTKNITRIRNYTSN